MICVIGDVGVEEFVRGKSIRFAPEALAPVIINKKVIKSPGCAANVAVSVKMLKEEVALFGVVGFDETAVDLTKALSSFGIHNIYGLQDSRRQTTNKQHIISENHQLARVDDEDTFDITNDQADRLITECIRVGPQVIIISDYNKGVVTNYLVKCVMEYALLKNVPVIVDPKGMDTTKYSCATVLKPNKKEAEAMCNCNLDDDANLLSAAERIKEMYNVKNVLISLSERGMFLLEENGKHHLLPTQTHNVVDIIGCGDSVVATLAVALKNKKSMLDAVMLANKAASIVVQKQGLGWVTPEELYG